LAAFTNLRWEAGVEGWELWGVYDNPGFYIATTQVAWIYENHHRGTWMAHVYGVADFINNRTEHEFSTLEDAQAWCIACVRMS
jgi:hypothetical protein